MQEQPEVEAELLVEQVWHAVTTAALAAGLDPAKFGPPHRQVVETVAHFLAPADSPPLALPSRFPRVPEPVKSVARPLVGRFIPPRPAPPHATPAPLILCGPPGTGKTTFMAVLDAVLRTQFGLPDAITPLMTKRDGRQHRIHKRTLNGRPLSLLSVRKWGELIHFFAWDVAHHRLSAADTADFMATVLAPMRILFTDEVEMTGYAPTLPRMAEAGLLVVGTSNQTEFAQLAHAHLPPQIVHFGGEDMRAGNPTDAWITAADPLWPLFEQAHAQPENLHGRLPYRTHAAPPTTYLLCNFRQAVQAPMLESEWVQFLQVVPWPLTLLLDDFSLEWLRTDFNAIMRFVGLFDAVEQVGIGVLVRQRAAEGETAVLSREALNHMKVTIHTARGVSAEIKQKVTVGLDRCTSRLGQAGYRARWGQVVEGLGD